MLDIITERDLTEAEIKSVHNVRKQDSCGYTLAMLWLLYRPGTPPKSLWHDSVTRTLDGQTLAMVWVETMSCYPPECLIHTDKICDAYGDNLTTYIRRYAMGGD